MRLEPGTGGVGEAAGYRQPFEAAPSQRGRSDGVPGGRVAGGSGLLLGRAPRPSQSPGHGWGRVLRAVRAGEAKNTIGKPRTASPLGGVWGALTSGLARPRGGGRSGIPPRYVATGPRSPHAKTTNRGIKKPWVRYLMVFFKAIDPG